MTKDKALKLALEALTNAIAVRNGEGGTKLVSPLEENAITAIKEALAQPAQEPVAWAVSPRYEDSDGYFDFTDSKDTAEILQKRGWAITPLYTAPPKQEPHNFCPRCGKRLIGMAFAAGGTHTCTPPEGGHQ